jgi:hypothetical protein
MKGDSSKWPTWHLTVHVLLSNGFRENYSWERPIPGATLQAIVNRAPKLVAATMTAHKVPGRSRVIFMRIEVRKAS